MSAKPFQSPLITKEACLQLHLYNKLIFSKKEWSGNKVRTVGNIEVEFYTISEKQFQSPLITKEVNVCNSIYSKKIIFSKKKLSGNKVMKEGYIRGKF
jgi:hypothetical protein